MVAATLLPRQISASAYKSLVACPYQYYAGYVLGLKELDEVPTPDANPDFFVDYDETGPYVAEVGDSECAT